MNDPQIKKWFGEVVGKEEDVFPVLFDEFAACFVDVDVLHGMPGHVV